ncbi:ATP-dependent nuclease [Lacinutrix algicola]|uniref:ATP-dependent nuclease n=1 Tax=Lacinutrix algicola TaxID=342954 RepID=UPI0009FB2C88|nr:AAA family ATPase [Lacinutrix algicola]
MKINKIQVQNFRLLDDINCSLENDITLIVGKNNTGKTSFFEAIKLATSTDGKFIFEDFSQSTYATFKAVHSKYLESKKHGITEEYKKTLEKQLIVDIPKIKISFEIEYNKENNESLVELSEFITDLEDARNDAVISISFEPKNTLKVFQSFENREDKAIKLIEYLHKNITLLYQTVCYAIDKESDYTRIIEDSFKTKIQKVVLFESIEAMRILDDTKGDSNNALSLGFSNYYNQRDKNNKDVIDLENALTSVSKDLKIKYNKVLEGIQSKLKQFGAHTEIKIPEIEIDSKFDSEKVLKNNIQYLYKQNEVNLPESYNGLGYSNLIYMILELASFIEKFKNSKEEKLSNFLVVLIEEPEAHMHPQMQQVFISQVLEVVKEAKKDTALQIQVIITTHSSHILSESGIETEKGFNRIRYFNRFPTDSGGYKITNQDFNNLKIKDYKRTFRFLRQYLTLHKSDLFFADKVILVEGTTERMLLPQMIQKSAKSLCNEYVSILEVGGAYAHSFREILEFINVRTLIITDIDSSDENGACQVSPIDDNKFTTNETLKKWLPNKTTIKDLTNCTNDEKTQENIRVAYQTNENSFIGRSFEESFINTNKTLLLSEFTKDDKSKIVVKNRFSFLKSHSLMDKIPTPSSSKVKTNFTFDIMSFNEEKYGEWKVPEYIKEGLIWLSKND